MDENVTITQPVFYILLTLSIKKSHGYEIMKKVSQYSNNKVKIGPGTLYTALKRLLENGFIEEYEDNNERRRYYQISDKGRELLSTELGRIELAIDIAKENNLLISM